ncbi:uncharacterized protein LOC110059357 [Orbicella faveolata]|uniref:uncharacterized protein LOC110059357 n=1 Tax=Orbicella faveolata TaxID=48498 RepID=UPI0009E25654|nr:uncharacterized protein LOC110059357 [Orbicella faveolata]
MWVYIDKTFLVQLFSDPLDSDVPCRTISLANAAGNGSIVPEGGSVIGGKCQSNGSLPAETVSLSLRINEAYRLDVFIAERFRCKSHILFQSSGVSFLLDDARPADYFAVISEDAHVGSLVQVRSALISALVTVPIKT